MLGELGELAGAFFIIGLDFPQVTGKTVEVIVEFGGQIPPVSSHLINERIGMARL